jgi:glycosyltransferase involved in cell wall biosynthesis
MKEVACTALKLPAERIHVIPHVQLGEDGAAPTQTTDDENIILFFGRIWGYKGLDYLIRAEPLITSRVPNAKIMIAGEGEDFARYRAMMQHPENFIVYNEFIPDDRVAEIFQRASVVALPYIEATQSGVVPMAYSYSKPVVATTVGGLPAVVEQGQTGFLVPPRDEQALADALVQLLQDKALCRQMGANGRHKVDMEFSAEIVAQKTLVVYRCAVAHTQSLNEMSASTKAKVKSSL